MTTDTLGPYRILGKLGEGGMGEVYRARDDRLDRDVAIKVLPSRLALDKTALARFEREARAVAALSHPNILAIFDVGEEAGVAYAVTELLEGETLRDRLRAGPLPLRKALEIGAQVALGLSAAHAKGIVHRDLKPENVFVTPDGRAKLLDFGLAKPAADGPGDAYDPTLVLASDPGMVAGTPPYMAPEQVRAQPVTGQTDIFALGSVLFEMLTGRRAFHGENAVETMTAVLREDPPDVATIDPTIPPAVGILVRHCLEKQPGERFQSARDVAFNLQSLAGMPTPTPGWQPSPAPGGPGAASSGLATPKPGDGEAGLATPEPRRGQGGPATPKPRRGEGGRRILLPALALVALLAVFAGGWWLGHRPVAAGPHFTRVSYTPKVVYRAAFSPEKDTIVYSAATDGNRPQLYQLGREYPSARLAGLPPDTHLLAVSRSGELALLVNARVVTSDILRGTLARMPLGATVPRPVLDQVRDADWAGGDGELAVVRGDGEKDRLECPPGRVIYRTDGYLTDLHVSPDGTRLAMFEHEMKWEAPAALLVLERDGRVSFRSGGYRVAHGLAWRPDGREILFSASARGEGDTAILAADMSGRTRMVLEVPGSLTVHDVSGDGRWLVSRDERRLGIRAQLAGETAERELSWLDRSQAAALTENGRTLLFTESAPPAGFGGTVCLRPTDGSPVESLGPGIAQDLSPDGAWALALASSSPEQLLVYPVGAGEKRALPRGPIESYRWSSWFPDGRRVLACGTERGRAARCYVQEVNGGAPRPVTGEGQWGIVSPDGQRILTWRPEAAPIIWRSDGTGQAENIKGVSVDDVPVRWTADGRGILVSRPHEVPGQVDRVDLGSGRRETVRRFSPPDPVGVLSLDPVLLTSDGLSYAYTYTRVLSTLFTVEGVK